MNQQIQHRMPNPMGQWTTLALIAGGAFLVFWYIEEEKKKKREGEVTKTEAVVIPPSAWGVDPNQPAPTQEVEAGQLYKAVFTLPLIAGAAPAYEIAYLPEIAFEVLDVLVQEIQDENQAPVGTQVTITFIPRYVEETEGGANIIAIAGNDEIFRGLSLNIQE